MKIWGMARKARDMMFYKSIESLFSSLSQRSRVLDEYEGKTSSRLGLDRWVAVV